MYYQTYLDQEQEIFSYQTGFAYPLFITVKKGKIEKYIEMTEGNIDEVCKLIQQYNWEN